MRLFKQEDDAQISFAKVRNAVAWRKNTIVIVFIRASMSMTQQKNSNLYQSRVTQKCADNKADLLFYGEGICRILEIKLIVIKMDLVTLESAMRPKTNCLTH